MIRNINKILGNFISQPNRDFPLDCETLEGLQNNSLLLSVLGNIAGDKTILFGCAENGVNRDAGYIFLRTAEFPAGEVLYFEGGSTALGFYVKKEAIAVTAQDIEYPQAYIRRSLAAGLGTEHFEWADFRRITNNAELRDKNDSQDADIAALLPAPIGVVQMFAGPINKIPQDWLQCEGQTLQAASYADLYEVIGRTHTASSIPAGSFQLPDLRSRFIVGFNATDTDYNVVGKVGGEKKHTLTSNEIPSHVHGHGATKGGKFVIGSGGANTKYGDNNRGVDEASREYRDTTAATGGGGTHENRPPYYTLVYIMRVK